MRLNRVGQHLYELAAARKTVEIVIALFHAERDDVRTLPDQRREEQTVGPALGQPPDGTPLVDDARHAIVRSHDERGAPAREQDESEELQPVEALKVHDLSAAAPEPLDEAQIPAGSAAPVCLTLRTCDEDIGETGILNMHQEHLEVVLEAADSSGRVLAG